MITVAPMCRLATYILHRQRLWRQTFLTDADVRSAPAESDRNASFDPSFVIQAWVSMPDHMHALWTLLAADEDFLPRGVSARGMVTQRCQTRPNRPEWMSAVAESGTKYRLALVIEGRCVLSLCNEPCKGDHRHVAIRSMPYRLLDAWYIDEFL